MRGPGADFMWDELAAAAWINPSVITKRDVRYMAVDTDHSASYGNTLTWLEGDKPSGNCSEWKSMSISTPRNSTNVHQPE